MIKKANQVQFFEETFTASDNYRYDGWLQIKLESGEVVSIPGNFFKRKCVKCGEVKTPYGLKGQCKECERGTQEKKKYKKIVFANCSIITTEGTFEKKSITLEEVKKLIFQTAHFESAIGHESTAKILSDLTSITVPVNRIKYEQKKDELMIVFQLRERPPEGKILSIEEIEKIGYDFYSIEKK